MVPARSRVQIVWFKRDLRVQDHEPLTLAAGVGPVVGLYIVEPAYWRLPDSDRRHWRFIRDCLIELDQELGRLGIPLIVRIGEATEVFAGLDVESGGFDLWSHEESGNLWTFERDRDVAALVKARGLVWQELPSHGVVRRLKSRDGWQRLRDSRMAAAQVLPPTGASAPAEVPRGDPLPGPDDPMFPGNPGSVQRGGRREGLGILESFLKKRSGQYLQTISKPGVSARHSSRLSPHIAFGSLSVREIEQRTAARMATLEPDEVSLKRNLSAFRSRLAWRCHFVQKLEQQPEIETCCMHAAFEDMRPREGREEYLTAWHEGRTGYPLIDAAMRSLHANGWITFRMRAMLVSFASYHLWLDWRQTAPLLARLFTDYEPGIHYSQFQMQSGVTGINAIRIYSPVKQSLDHDPEGRFIRRYVPELAEVGGQWIHEPWRMPAPPAGYPRPIVDHENAMRHARSEIAKRRHQAGFRDVAAAVNDKLGSRAKPPSRTKKPRPDMAAKSQLSFDW